MAVKRLIRSRNSKICGVAGGIAEYFTIDPTLIRLAFVLLALFGGGGVLLYIIMAIIMPAPTPIDYSNIEVDEDGKVITPDDVVNGEKNDTGKWIASLIGVFCIIIGLCVLFRNVFHIPLGHIWGASTLILVGVIVLAFGLIKR